MKRSIQWMIGIVLLSLTAISPAAAQEGDRPIVATDLFRIEQLGSVAVSPGGRQVVYTVRRIVTNDEGRHVYRTQLFAVDSDGRTAPRQLTFGPEGASQPAWHPDGDRLAFVRPVEGKPQVFVLPLTGGEAYQLTGSPYGAGSPAWSPDGTKLLYRASLSEEEVRVAGGGAVPWPQERPGRTPADTTGVTPDPDGSLAQVQAWLDRNAGEANPRVFDRLDLQGEFGLQPAPSFSHYFVVTLPQAGDEGMPPPPATPLAGTPVTHGYYAFGGGAWTADGEQIILSGAVVPDHHPDRVRERYLYVVNADGTGFRRLLALDGYDVSNPVVSPHGDLLAFVARDHDDAGYAQSELGLMPLDGPGTPELLTLDFDRSVGGLQWSDDGWYLYFTASADGAFPLYRMPAYAARPPSPAPVDTAAADTVSMGAVAAAPDTSRPVAVDTLVVAGTLDTPPARAIEQLTGFDAGVRSYDVGRNAVFIVLTQVANPFELYRSDPPFDHLQRLTAHNASWLADRRISFPEVHTLQRDTLSIQYWVMKPTFFEEGQRYPLLLEMHGGPSAMWGPGEATMWHEFQLFAAKGYGIVFANPRGSGGYGHAFKKANYRDWGRGPAGDVLAAATQAAKAEWVDPDRQVITGGSYAGYLTAWVVTQDHRFQAAVAQRGVYDLGVFMGEGNAWRLVPNHFGGYPWDDSATVAGDSLFVTGHTPGLVALDEGGDALPTAAAADTVSVPLWQREPEPAPSDTTGAPLEGTASEETTTGYHPDLLSAREVLIRNSPITYVDQITTPLLIIHGDVDKRTGPTQSEVLYKSLKILGRPVEYARYPHAGHDLSRTGDPDQRLDRLLRIYEFLARFVE